MCPTQGETIITFVWYVFSLHMMLGALINLDVSYFAGAYRDARVLHLDGVPPAGYRRDS